MYLKIIINVNALSLKFFLKFSLLFNEVKMINITLEIVSMFHFHKFVIEIEFFLNHFLNIICRQIQTIIFG